MSKATKIHPPRYLVCLEDIPDTLEVVAAATAVAASATAVDRASAAVKAKAHADGTKVLDLEVEQVTDDGGKPLGQVGPIIVNADTLADYAWWSRAKDGGAFVYDRHHASRADAIASLGGEAKNTKAVKERAR